MIILVGDEISKKGTLLTSSTFKNMGFRDKALVIRICSASKMLYLARFTDEVRINRPKHRQQRIRSDFSPDTKT